MQKNMEKVRPIKRKKSIILNFENINFQNEIGYKFGNKSRNKKVL